MSKKNLSRPLILAKKKSRKKIPINFGGFEMAKIEKGLEMPEQNTRKTKYPWAQIEVGDSFVYDGPMNAAWTNCRYASEKHKKKFEPRVYQGAVRVWRTQ